MEIITNVGCRKDESDLVRGNENSNEQASELWVMGFSKQRQESSDIRLEKRADSCAKYEYYEDGFALGLWLPAE